MPATLPGEYGFISGFSAVGNTIWFGTTLGRIWKSTNFGKDWAAYIADPSGKFVNEIAFNDDKLHGVAHLRDNNYQTFLYSTFDGGITWTNLGQPANWKSSRITAVPGTNALVSTSVNSLILAHPCLMTMEQPGPILKTLLRRRCAGFLTAIQDMPVGFL